MSYVCGFNIALLISCMRDLLVIIFKYNMNPLGMLMICIYLCFTIGAEITYCISLTKIIKKENKFNDVPRI